MGEKWARRRRQTGEEFFDLTALYALHEGNGFAWLFTYPMSLENPFCNIETDAKSANLCHGRSLSWFDSIPASLAHRCRKGAVHPIIPALKQRECAAAGLRPGPSQASVALLFTNGIVFAY